jgi:hypothetical protein
MSKKITLFGVALLVVSEVLNTGDKLGGPVSHMKIVSSLIILTFLHMCLIFLDNRHAWVKESNDSPLDKDSESDGGFGQYSVVSIAAVLKKKFSVDIAVILLLAFALRAINFTGMSYTADETIHLALAERIPQTIIPVLPSGLIYIRSFIFSYLTTIPAQLLGLNEFGLRIPSILYGTALVLVIFWVGSEMFSRNVGLISSAFVAVDPYLIAYSQIARFYILFYFLVSVSVFAFYKSYVKNDWSKVTFGVLLTATLITHDLAAFIGPVIFAWWFITQRKGLNLKDDLNDSAYIIIPGIIFLLYYRLKSYLFLNSTPGVRLAIGTDPIFGFNMYNIIYYRELLLNPYPVGWIFAIYVIGLLIFGEDKLSIPNSWKLNSVYIGSFVLMYISILGFFIKLDGLRFIIVVVPLLHLLFAVGLDRYYQFFMQKLSDLDLDVSRSTGLQVFIVAVLLINAASGSMVVSYDHNISEIPDEEESNLQMISYHLGGDEYAFHAKTMHQGIYNYKDAAVYTRERINQDDIVISTANFNPVYPYIAVDYSTNEYISRYLGYRESGQRHELYRGIPVVTTEEQIQRIYEQEGEVYVIAGPLLEEHATDEVESYIKSNSELVYRSKVSSSKRTFLFGNRSEIRVYKEKQERNQTDSSTRTSARTRD